MYCVYIYVLYINIKDRVDYAGYAISCYIMCIYYFNLFYIIWWYFEYVNRENDD